MAKIDSETRDEQINNLGLRVQGVSFFNAFIRKGETREEAMKSIARAAEELVGDE